MVKSNVGAVGSHPEAPSESHPKLIIYEDYGPAEPEDELLSSDREPISSHGERPGELLELDQLTTLMEEDLPGDLVAKLTADRDRYLRALSAEESRALVERLAAAG